MKHLPFGELFCREGLAARIRRIVVAACLALPPAALGEGIVTDCTQEALLAALQGGGLVRFQSDCSITLTQAVPIETTNTIDSGGFKVTLSGGGTTRIFNVSGNLTLLGLNLVDGKTNNGGAIFVEQGGSLVASNCTFQGNIAVGTNGVAGADGEDSEFGTGDDGGNGSPGTAAAGGSIFNQGAVRVVGCLFSTNSATGGNGGNGGSGGNSAGTLGIGGDGGNGAAGAAGVGGAIYNTNNLTVIECTFTGNSASGGTAGTGGAGGTGSFAGRAGSGAAGAVGYGGAIYNARNLTMWGSAFSSNSARGGNSTAGGVYSVFDGEDGPNGPEAGGGALCNVWWGVLTNCTFYTNTAEGGAGGNGGVGTRSTSKGGDGGDGGNGVGGGILSRATLRLISCTLANCGAYGGTNGAGGIAAFTGADGDPGLALGGNLYSGTANTSLRANLIGSAPSGGAGSGTITDEGYNMIPDASLAFGAQSFPNTTTLNLGSFGDHGGPTPTVSLLTNSPAINKVPAGLSPAIDQRGFPRPQPTGGSADIGAYEYELASPPLIVRDLADTNVVTGAPVTFTISVIGATPLRYQWRLQEQPIAGATTSSYVVNNSGNASRGPYMVVITNSHGSVISAPATIHFRPAITTQPASQTVSVGSNVVFSAAATGDSPLAYQWTFNNADLAGKTNITLTLTNVQMTDAGSYRLKVSNPYGTNFSTAAALNFLPSILSPPQTLLVARGETAVFDVTAEGTEPLWYQWRFNGIDLSGMTNCSLVVSNVQASEVGAYSVVVRNVYGSTAAAANLNLKLSIIQAPASLTVAAGETVEFGVVAEGTPPLSYLWFRNGAAISGATATSYQINNAQPQNAGVYTVQVRDALTNVVSGPATLTVTHALSVFGWVTNASGFGVSGVRVSATDTNFVVTDASGFYVLSGLEPKEYNITASAPCYSVSPGSVPVLVGGETNAVANFTATRRSYGISGSITGTAGPVTNIILVLSGDSAGLVATTINGSYSFTNLCPGTYVVTPQGSCYNFQPRALTNTIVATVSEQNFSAVPNVYSVEGTITLGTAGLANVRVTAGSASALTDTNGRFMITNLCPGSYTITPSSGCIGFNPPQRPVVLGPNVTGLTFAAYTNDIYSASGRVALDGTNGLPGVLIASGDRSVTTDTNGNYVVPHLCPGQNTITPSLSGYGFSPSARTLALSSDVTGQNFTAFRVYSISGEIIGQTGQGLAGITVQAGTNTAVTGSDGKYALTNLPAGTYTITPTQACSLFIPASRSATLGPDSSGLNFTAVANNVFVARGQVAEGTNLLAGVTLWMTNHGGLLTSTLTDARGYYEFQGLCPGRYTIEPSSTNFYTVEPSFTNFVFRPAKLDLNLTSDLNALNFSAHPSLSITHISADQVYLRGGGTIGDLYTLESSTDLLQWSAVYTNAAVLEFTEPVVATNAANYYRLRRHGAP